jgi:hypothetical protein
MTSGSTTPPPATVTPVLTIPEGLQSYLLTWGVPEPQLFRVSYKEDDSGDQFLPNPEQEAGFTPEYTDLSGAFTAKVTISDAAAETLNSLYGCGTATEEVQTFCPRSDAQIPAGEALIVGGTLNGEFPETPDRECVLAALFNVGNLWRSSAPDTNHYYNLTGTWYEVTIGSDGSASALSSRVSSSGEPRQPFESNARFFLARGYKTFGAVIPLDEVPDGTYRTAVDCHGPTLDPADSGGDVAPGREPNEFLGISGLGIELDEICGGTCVEGR